MDDEQRPTRDYHRTVAHLVRQAPSTEAAAELLERQLGALALAQAAARQNQPARAAHGLSRRRPRDEGQLRAELEKVNRHRRRIAGPAVAEQRALDDACAALCADWYEAIRAYRPIRPRTPRRGLAPGRALVLGALVWLEKQPVHGTPCSDALLACFVPQRPRPVHQRWKIPADLRPLLRILAREPRWRARIRRCMAWHAAIPSAACCVFFLDRSRRGNAGACSPAHSVRIVEALGARNRRVQSHSRL